MTASTTHLELVSINDLMCKSKARDGLTRSVVNQSEDNQVTMDSLTTNQRPVLPRVCEGPVLEVQALEQGLAVPLGPLCRAVSEDLVLYFCRD